MAIALSQLGHIVLVAPIIFGHENRFSKDLIAHCNITLWRLDTSLNDRWAHSGTAPSQLISVPRSHARQLLLHVQ